MDSDNNIQSLKKLLEDHCGIKIPSTRDSFLLDKITQRLDALKLESINEYFYYLFEKGDEELHNLINLLTINKTYFFRHINQFKLLRRLVQDKMNSSRSKSITIWCAGCSIGAEPYTIAIYLNDYIEYYGLDLRIIATDIDQEILKKARDGIYSKRCVTAEMPHRYKDEFFTGIRGEHYHISDDIKQRVQFKRHNLQKDVYLGEADFIFCRNVLIYFNKVNRTRILRNFHTALKTDGFLFLSPVEYIPRYLCAYFIEEFGPHGVKAYQKWNTDRRERKHPLPQNILKLRKPLESYPFPEVHKMNDSIQVAGIIQEEERIDLVSSELVYCIGQLKAERRGAYTLDFTRMRYISNDGLAAIIEIIHRGIKEHIFVEKIIVKDEYLLAVLKNASFPDFGKIVIQPSPDSGEVQEPSPHFPAHQLSSSPPSPPAGITPLTRHTKPHPERKKKIQQTTVQKPQKRFAVADQSRGQRKTAARSKIRQQRRTITISDIMDDADIEKYQEIFALTLHELDSLPGNPGIKVAITAQYIDKDFFIIFKRFITLFAPEDIEIQCPPHIRLWLKKYQFPANISYVNNELKDKDNVERTS